MGGFRNFALHHPSLAYSATTLGAGMMNSVFMTYYVKTYLNRFHVSEQWFHVSQIVFMIWNAVNDPLFGYIQDNFSFSWVRSRRHSILYGAPFFGLSFLLTWIPWGDYSEPSWLCGFQLMFALCFYDTMYTFVLLAQCALFTEMSQLQDDRIRLIKYSQAASFIGSSAVYFTGLASQNGQDYGRFLFCCAVISVLSFICMTYTGRNSFTEDDLKLGNVTGKTDDTVKIERNGNESTKYSVWRQMFQIFSQRNFVSFVLVNLCQIYQRTYIYNFVMIVCDSLIPVDVLNSGLRSIFYGSLHTLPQIAVILATGTSFLSTFGYHTIMKNSFIFKIIVGMGLFIIGPKWWALVLFFVIESIESSAVFHTFNLCLSDIIDTDKETYRRRHPLSSLVYGTNAMFTKPAQSFAPMLNVLIFNAYGYEKSVKVSHDTNDHAELKNSMFLITCATPVLIGAVQIIIWSFYKTKCRIVNIKEYDSGITPDKKKD